MRGPPGTPGVNGKPGRNGTDGDPGDMVMKSSQMFKERLMDPKSLI